MGLLDAAFRDIAKNLIGTLGTSLVVFSRVDRTYDEDTDTSTEVSSTASLHVTPPAPYSEYKIDGAAILATDSYVMVAAKDVEDASFSFDLGSSATITVVIDGKTFSIVSSKKVYSGDEVAAYELQLR